MVRAPTAGTAGAGSYLVLEEYTDTAAAMVHQERAAELLARVGQCAELVHAELYGSIGPELRAWVRSHPQASVFADFPEHDAEG